MIMIVLLEKLMCDYTDSIGCGDLLKIYKQDAKCRCLLYGGLSARVCGEAKDILEPELEGDMQC